MQENAAQNNPQPVETLPLTASKKSSTLLIIGVAVLIVIVIGVLAFLQWQQSRELKQLVPDQNGTQRGGLSELIDSSQSSSVEEIEESEAQPQTDLPPLDSAQQPPVSQDSVLKLELANESVQTGESIEMKLVLTTSVQPDGIQFLITYDPQLLSQVQLEPANTFGSFLSLTVDESAGKIKGALLRNPSESVGVTSPLSIIKVKGKANGAGKLSMIFDKEYTQVAAAGGQEILDKAVDLSVDIR
ncbi:MAG TPA: cohesin domain-containing protein [Candidatus Woesebacteria bacterium]|nr:cohesin domain-containing protein [Candidatus Woesebacteria bacterium]